jgi:hypothetical protein
MVTTAPAIIHESVKRRPASYGVFLWSIPLLSWVLLIAVFFTSARQDMAKLLITNNTVLMKNVQHFLESENVPFVVEDNVILIGSADKSRVLSAVSRQKWYEPGAGWDRTTATTPHSAPHSLSNLARDNQASEGS